MPTHTHMHTHTHTEFNHSGNKSCKWDQNWHPLLWNTHFTHPCQNASTHSTDDYSCLIDGLLWAKYPLHKNFLERKQAMYHRQLRLELSPGTYTFFCRYEWENACTHCVTRLHFFRSTNKRLGNIPAQRAALTTAQFSELVLRSRMSPPPLARTKPLARSWPKSWALSEAAPNQRFWLLSWNATCPSQGKKIVFGTTAYTFNVINPFTAMSVENDQ